MEAEAFDLETYLAEAAARVNRALRDYLPCDPGRPDRLVAAMSHSLMAGGKRIRPILCMAAAEAVGGRAEEALPAACAFEMVHTYSLIHDDLPAMDDDDLRRGRPTCHVAFDEATAILAGDALMALAFEVIAAAPGAPPERRLEAVRILAAASGASGMAQGQMRDIQSEGIRLTLDQLKAMHALKTGAMIEAALVCGAVVAGAAPEPIERLKGYGRAVGLAFQVTDDILNVEGDASLLGKSVGTDELREKNCFPVLLGLEKSKEFAENLIQDAVSAIAGFDRKADPLRAIARYVVRRNR
jgi:geranylgeranyl diphosphate synthase type II